jgi:hypothetical protein
MRRRRGYAAGKQRVRMQILDLIEMISSDAPSWPGKLCAVGASDLSAYEARKTGRLSQDQAAPQMLLSCTYPLNPDARVRSSVANVLSVRRNVFETAWLCPYKAALLELRRELGTYGNWSINRLPGGAGAVTANDNASRESGSLGRS